MRVTVEMSLYPLQGSPIEKILAFIETIQGDARLEVVVNQMSTQLRGELGSVMETLQTALMRSFTGGGPQALVVKFLNADLPIGDAPVPRRRLRRSRRPPASMSLEVKAGAFALAYLVLASNRNPVLAAALIGTLLSLRCSSRRGSILSPLPVVLAMAVYGWRQWRRRGPATRSATSRQQRPVKYRVAAIACTPP
jgi:uncharacterized protein YqgV (UPF0045/DUF77 family)